ncbi:unnamed protein product [Lactuca saligna]|uniref:Uncharacterized protein n=1 Tax=Lactuca saligna TaxID=75948 RepID=A0AA35Y746_LACSI|nr:unnamed protein product [Lactuca saligna]
MNRGKAVVDGGVSVEGTSGSRPHEKLKAELELSDLEDSLEPTTPLNLSERDEEDEDVESKVEPEEDPEEEPEEDADEELEEDPEEEPKGNHVEYHVEQRYETFHIPYVEYTPTSPGTYWERVYKDEMPQAQLEIHSLKRKIKEIDEHRSRLVLENQIRVEAAEKSKRKIRRSGRFTRVTPEEERIPIGAYVRAPGDVPETPLNPNASRGRGQGRGRGEEEPEGLLEHRYQYNRSMVAPNLTTVEVEVVEGVMRQTRSLERSWLMRLLEQFETPYQM